MTAEQDEQWVEPIPEAGWWESTHNDTDQTVTVTGPEGHSESRDYSPVEDTGRAAHIAAAQAKLDAAMAEAAATLAQSMATTASQEAATADKRITIAASNPGPSHAEGRPVGAIWEVRTEGTAVRRFILTSKSPVTWTQVKIGQDFIGENAIGQAQIMDLAVGTAQIALAAITDAQIDKLSASKIDAVTFDGYEIRGAKIISPSALGEIELFNNLLQVKRAAGVDGMQVTTSLGSPSAAEDDAFELYPAGSTAPGVMLSGNGLGSFERVTTDTIEVNGVDIGARLRDLPQGIIGKHFGTQAAWPANGVGTSPYGLVKFRIIPIRAHRQYRITAKLKFANADANTRLRLALRHSTGAGNTATVASAILDEAQYAINGAGDTIVYDHVFGYNADTEREVLLTINLISGSLPLKLDWDANGYTASHVQLEDLGKLDYALGDVSAEWTAAGGTAYAGGAVPPPVPQPRTFTQEWPASHVKSWRGNAEIGEVLHHGTFGGVKRVSQVVFNWPEIAAALSGATINWVQIKLKNLHAHNSSGMTVNFKGSTHTSVVAGSTQPSIGGASINVAIPQYYNGWFDITTAFAANIRSIWLGMDAPTSLTHYGHFSRLAADCVLQINYTK